MARTLGARRVGLVEADDEIALTAAADALELGIAHPVLIGNKDKISLKAQLLGLRELLARAEFRTSTAEDAAAMGVRLARDGSIDILMKGHLRSDELLRPVLDKSTGFATGRQVSDVAPVRVVGMPGR